MSGAVFSTCEVQEGRKKNGNDPVPPKSERYVVTREIVQGAEQPCRSRQSASCRGTNPQSLIPAPMTLERQRRKLVRDAGFVAADEPVIVIKPLFDAVAVEGGGGLAS